MPVWLCRHAPDEAALSSLEPAQRMGGETKATQVFDRLAGSWTYWGWKGGYFDGEADARAFYDEMCYMLAAQMGAPNSPQWFNTGLHWAYGIDGPAQGHYYVDYRTGKLVASESAYEHPQPHACFIQSVADDLVNEGGIMDLWVREARLFKYGSGTGSNFSTLRGEDEPLSGGGSSSGLMSFLKIGDRAAGAIKSGGTTRRAAKMVIGRSRSSRHRGVHQLEGGRGAEGGGPGRRLQARPEAPQRHHPGLRSAEDRRGPLRSEAEQGAAQGDPRRPRSAMIPENYIQPGDAVRASRAMTGSTSAPTTPTGIRRPISPSPARTPTTRCASPTPSSRRSRPTATGTSTGAPTARSPRPCPPASSGRRSPTPPGPAPIPGVQYDTTINEWHTCPASGRINASNPCSEYMFLDDTACNLAS